MMKPSCTAALLSVVLAGTLVGGGTAQGSPQFQFAVLRKHPRTPNENLNPSTIALGDVDSNGTLDAVLFDNYRLRLFRNDGRAEFSDVDAGFATLSDFARAGALRDVDGDLDLDLVLPTAKQNRLYLNDGSGRFADVTATHMPIDADITTALAIGDLDRDGDLDLVLGNGVNCTPCPGPLSRVYRNDGRGRFSEAPWSLPPDPLLVSAAALGDADGDGDLDLVLAGGQQTQLYLNDGAGVFSNVTARWMPVDSVWISHVAFADVDGDGDPDLVLARSDYNATTLVRLYRNDTTAFSDVTAAQMNGIRSRCTGLALADMDRDGDLDLVLGSEEQFFYGRFGTALVHSNDGSGRFAATSSAGLGGTLDRGINVRTLAVGDLDHDGDFDLLTGNHAAPVRVLLGTGSGRLLDVRVPNVPMHWYTGHVQPLDVDGDHFPDFASAERWASNHLARNDGQGAFRLTAAAWPETQGGLRVTAGDVDGDGDVDLLFATAMVNRTTGNNELYRNNGRGGFVRGTGMPPDRDHTRAIALADVDGDGDVDFVAANFGQPSKLYLNDGSLNFTFTLSLKTGPTLASDAAFGDLDGDGDADLLLAIHDGQSRLFLNDGLGNFTEATAARLPAAVLATQALLLLDVDGNGTLDALLGGDHNRLYANDGRGFFTDVTASRLPAVSGWTWQLAAGDIDQDGAADLALATVVGPGLSVVFKLLRNDGTGRYEDITERALPSATSELMALALLDVDDDGDADLLAGEQLFFNLHRQLHTAELARPGMALPIRVHAQPGYAKGFQLVAPFAGVARLPTPLDLPPLGRLRIDPTLAVPLPTVLIAPPGGVARLDVMLPDLAALRGMDLLVQAVILHTAQPADARLTGLLFEPIH